MKANLYGNPHSANGPAHRSGCVVDGVREKALRFFGADPRHFDLVFVSNSTAGIKLVADSFRDLAEKTRSGSFWYGYHKDAHTSLVGIRELTRGHSHCFESDIEVERWLENPELHGRDGRYDLLPRPQGLGLFAYPGQSNMSGRRLPLSWTGAVRSSAPLQNTYTLLDCAALAMTSPLHPVFRDPDSAPDFACVSFYKIFGFPDLGALIVRKDSGHILTLRKYFGGGTVTMVSVLGGTWHKLKGRDAADPYAGGIRQDHGDRSYEIHDGLEDGTLPFHNILALGEAIDVHLRLYGSMDNVSRHTTNLSIRLYQRMKYLTHANGRPLCHIYTEDDGRGFGDPRKQGATVAFNLLDAGGYYIPYADVERIANEHGCYVRSGGICCPGGIFTALEYEPWQLQRAFSAHHSCGPDGISLIQQLPTG
ncbi:PLP-dependent transferase [Cryphonectria parasitica EP155]|uniref:PLP-dependent transferase n=1 Tax=Cryphonectria parasitica (strain ATCC 38755 / EP155) TaxID=660469 RepID=A0A9P4XWZ1_CRYP1|nr:PLP-dependent transferase [Cryphonectria parasitica EP155]KAF3762464.1 PLP-dependent transferase [Cryphonectria parasitica EP155]